MASSFLLPALALVASFAAAEDAKITAEDSVPDWVSDVALGMSLSTMQGQDDPYQYFVVPLTVGDGDEAQSPSVCLCPVKNGDAESGYDGNKHVLPRPGIFRSLSYPLDLATNQWLARSRKSRSRGTWCRLTPTTSIKPETTRPKR